MTARLTLASLAIAGALTVSAQTPAPVIVQAIPSPTTAATAPVPAAATDQGALKILQEMKAANEALLSKQTAILEQLDELEKAAEQIKIYSKRG